MATPIPINYLACAVFSMSPFKAGQQSTEWQVLSVNLRPTYHRKGKRRKRERDLQTEY